MAAGAVGVADHLDVVLVVLLEGGRQVVQRAVEVAGDIRGVGGEGDVAGHDQVEVVALALHLYTGAFHAAAQFRFLLVDVVAIAGTGCASHGSADQRALATVVVIDRGTGDGTCQGAQGAVLGGLAHAALARGLGLGVVGALRGTARQHGESGDGDDQATRGEHGLITPEKSFSRCGCGQLDIKLRRNSVGHARTKGFSRISSPSRVSGPWPVTTVASSSRL
ncbi:hypothetical protein D9M68_654630 [compost metagenome]